MDGFKATHARSLAKAISWRFFATSTTMTIVYCFTGHLALSAGIGAVEVVSKLLIYYFHERIWNVVSFGRKIDTGKDQPQKDVIFDNVKMVGSQT